MENQTPEAIPSTVKDRLIDALQNDVCIHCGKRGCDCTSMPDSMMAPDLVPDPRARRCSCGQYLYPDEICRCQWRPNDDES